MSFVSTFNHTNSMTDNIIDRDNLQDAYIKALIDGMDFKTMEAFVYDTINENLESYSMKELIEEVENYDPELRGKVTQTDRLPMDGWTGGTHFWHGVGNRVL